MNKPKFLTLLLFFIGISSFSQSKKWTLQECVDYAIKNNITLKQSELDIENAEIANKAALGNFLPTINANASHSWNIGLNQNITTGLLQNQTTQFSSIGLNSNITIYNGLQNINKLRRAKLAKIGTEFQLAKMKDDISLNVANAYLQILFNKEYVKVQQEQVANSQKQLTKIDETVKAGLLPRGDLLDIKATLASYKQQLVDAENNLFLSKLSLAQLLQIDDFANFDTAQADYAAINSTVMIEKPETIIEKAKQERNELKIAQNSFELAQKDLKIAKGAYQPSLSGFYAFNTRASYSQQVVGAQLNTNNPTSTIGYVNGTGQEVVQPNYTAVLGKADPILEQFDKFKGHNFGFQLNIPILNGFAIKNNVDRAKIAIERSKIAQKQAHLDLERNVYTAITNAKGAQNTYQSSIAALDARKEAYNYAKEKYAVGMMNSFDFNQAESLYIKAQSDVLRTKYDSIFKIKIVEFYFGIPITN